MDDGLKKRLIGAAVLASLAVIFVPMLFEAPPPEVPELPPLPKKPPASDFASEMLQQDIPAVTPLAPSQPPAVIVPLDEPVAPPPESASLPQVASETEQQPRTGLTAWVVQVGSFSSQENAEKLVGKLREAGLPAPDAELVDIRGKRYYRVRVGPVVERSEADSMVARVNAVSGTHAQVLRYP